MKCPFEHLKYHVLSQSSNWSRCFTAPTHHYHLHQMIIDQIIEYFTCLGFVQSKRVPMPLYLYLHSYWATYTPILSRHGSFWCPSGFSLRTGPICPLHGRYRQAGWVFWPPGSSLRRRRPALWMLSPICLSRPVDQSPPGNRLHPYLDVIKSSLTQHWEDAVHMVLVHGMVLPNVTRINFPINLLRWSNLPPSRISASHSTRNSPWRTMSQSCASHATSSCAKFVQFGTHCRHPPFVPWCTPLSAHASTFQTASSTGRARIFSIVFSRSWTPQRVWFWNSGNTTRSQPQSDATFTGCQSKLVYASRWTSSQEIVLWVKLQSTWPSSAVLSTKSWRGATYDRRHKFSLLVPRFRKERTGRRGFSISSPQLWNLLPVDIRILYEEPHLFRKRLKTHLMQQSIFHHWGSMSPVRHLLLLLLYPLCYNFDHCRDSGGLSLIFDLMSMTVVHHSAIICRDMGAELWSLLSCI